MSTLDELRAVGRFLAAFPGPWWGGGGWALDLWTGGPSRDHEDIEICIRHTDQDALYTYCAGYAFFTSRNDQWVPFPAGAGLAFPDFQLWHRAHPSAGSLD